MLVLGVFIICVGYAVTKYRLLSVNTTTLQREVNPTEIIGIINNVRQYEDGKLRITVEKPIINNVENLNLINIRVNKYDEMPFIGDKIRIRAGLMPPPGPSMPGDYDYARQIWFENISAVGYGVSSLQIIEKERGSAAFLYQIRQRTALRIQQQLEGEVGSLAAALITGIRGAMPEKLVNSMRDAGLAHLLAISGLHMGLLCGVVFYITRFVLSRIPSVALLYPIKKWAAIIASFAGLGYLALSGASIPTIRAFIMVVVVFVGVLTDRKAISLRLVAIAATIILILTPEALIGVSFQMSFAAVVALVVAFEGGGNDFLNGIRGDTGFHRKAFYFLVASLLTSLIAELAIAPFALYHFNKIVLFGLIANLIAMPVMGSWVMPWIVVTLVLMPFGIEKIALIPLSWGLHIIMETAYFVSNLPGATLSLPAIDIKALVFLVIGALWMAVWRLNWRYFGIPIMIIGIVFAFFSKRPDILIDNEGKMIGILNNDDTITLSKLNGSRIVKDRWQQRFGQEENLSRWQYETFAPDRSEGRELSCDGLSCLYRPLKANNLLVSFVQNEQALLEDCQNADVIISLVPVEINCSASTILDKWDFYNNGGYALWLPTTESGDIKIENVKASRGHFPWAVYP